MLGATDMFGEHVKLTYKGEESFTTTFGGLLSMLLIFVLLSFSIYKTSLMISRSNPNVSQHVFMKDLDTEPPFTPYSNDSTSQVGGFDFAFGLGRPIDETIGHYTVNEVDWHYSKN